jgi:hypothetical protein
MANTLRNVTSAFLNNIAAKIADSANAFLYQGTSITNVTKKQPYELSNYEQYYQFLDVYHFVEALLNIIGTTVSEAIESTQFKISIPDDDSGQLSELLSECFRKLSLKETIINDIRQYIYRGKYIYSLDLNNMKLSRFTDPYNFKMVERQGTMVGSMYQGKFINSQECITYYYNKWNETPVPRDKVKSQGISELAKFIKDDKSKNAKYIVDYNIFEGKSIFMSQLLKIYQMYVLEYALYFLGLRESIRPDIVSMTITAQRKDTMHASNAAERIEALLNQPSGMIGQIQDPIAFINELTYSLLNNIKVVPNVDNYTNMNTIDLPDSTAKREKLKAEKEDLMNQILANLGVPAELYLGQSNRWEVMSRNDRYLTLIKNILSTISRMVRQLSVSILLKYTGKKYNQADLVFNMESNNYMATFMKQTRIQGVANRLMNTDQVIQYYQSWNQNELLKKDNIRKYFAAVCASSDENLVALLGLDDIGTNDKKDRRNLTVKLPDTANSLDDSGGMINQSRERRNIRPLIDPSSMNNNGMIETIPDYRSRRSMNVKIHDMNKLNPLQHTPINTENVRRDETDSRRHIENPIDNLDELDINKPININEVRR